jgi:enoyl-CoA hydratase/carnithine racemase
MQLSRGDFLDTTNPMNFIPLSKSRRVTTITLNRPAVMNAINPEMQDELRTAIDEFAENDEQYICVLTGAGERAFCAGTDLKSPGRVHAKATAGLESLRNDCPPIPHICEESKR